MNENGIFMYRGDTKTVKYSNYQSDGFRSAPHPTGLQVDNFYDFMGTAWFSSDTTGEADPDVWRADAYMQ